MSKALTSGSATKKAPFPKGSVTLHLIVITVLGLLVYSNTFNVPFQWDEDYFIVKNPIVKDLNYFLEPSRAKGFELYSALKTRYMGYLTFALNYKIHGLDVRGYHTVNLSVHILNALLVYFLVILTFKTPFLENSSLKKLSKHIALFTGLLFVSHPVQTEAVTYIFQRLASLMAFFYLLSLTAYIGSRLSTGNARRYTLYALSLVSAVLAMKTKENAFTLPLVITLYEFLFFLNGPVKRRVLRLVPLLLTLFIIPLTLTGIDRPVGEIIGGIGPATRGYEDISRGDYLLTGLRVIVTYIKLLFLPVNQNFGYDYPIFRSILNPQVFLSLLFLLLISGFAVYLHYRSRFTVPDLRLIAFCIFWFFITLSLESSIIPIPMVINEYRVYLPSVGAFLAVTAGVFLLMEKFKSKKIQTITALFFIVTSLVFSYATYARNTVWESRISLWEDVASKSPWNAHAHTNLGSAYMSAGLTDKALEHYRTALRLKPDYAETHYNLGIAYESDGLIDKATAHYLAAVRLKPDYAEAHNNLGNAYSKKGLTDRAIEHHRIAVKLKPEFAVAHYNLGFDYWSGGLTDKAVKHYQAAARLKPDYAEAHYNLGLIYLEKGVTDRARREFETALQINPAYHKARRFLDYITNPDKTRTH